MPSTRLNYDVLLSILSVSPPKTATSIMATCSFLYHDGAKIILQDPVELKGSEEEALAVLRFVQAEDLSRCPHLRALDIVMLPAMSQSIAQILADIVPRMTGLEWLTLIHSEQMFESYPRLLPAVSGLRSLKMLMMTSVGERSTEMIRTLQSHLIYASIHFPPTAPPDSPLVAASEPILFLLLGRFATTLKQLLCACPVHTSPERTFSNSPPTVICPELRFLHLFQKFPPDPIPFMEAFPNLTQLRVLYEGGLKDEMLESYWSNRELNLSLQRPSETGEPFGWKHLQEFIGHPADLWALGLACRIPQLTLRGTPSARSPLIFTDVLAFARPTGLTVTFENHSLTSVLGGGFLNALQSEGASGLRSLAFVIDLMAADRNLNFVHAMGKLAFALSGLKLSDLLFTVRDMGLSETVESAAPADPGRVRRRAQSAPSSPTWACERLSVPDLAEDHRDVSLSLAERTLHNFDVALFVSRLVNVIPTVQNIVVGVEWPGQCGGGLRIGYSVKGWHKWVRPIIYAGGNMAYREARGANYNRDIWASVVKGWNSHMTVGDM